MDIGVAEDLVADVQDAFLHPGTWTAVLDRLTEAVGGTGAVILSLTDRSRPSPTSTSLQAGMEEYRRSEWCRRDLRVRGIPQLLSAGVTVDQDFCSAEEMRRHPFYADFLARHGLRWFAGIGFMAGEAAWCLALQRSPSQGPFEPREQAALRRLCAPLSAAGAIAGRIEMARASGVVDGLDAIGCAAALLDPRGRLVVYNTAAAPHFGRDLTVKHGQVMPRRGPCGPLSAHIASALARAAGCDPPVIVPRANGRGLLLVARPLHGEAGSFFHPARILLTIVDLETKARGDLPGLLRHTFRLTSSEARVAHLVGQGDSVKDAADRLGLSVGTVRSVLKHVFAKCAVSRQAELVSLFTHLRTAADLSTRLAASV